MAVVIDKFGSPSVLNYREVPVQPPLHGELVVKVHAVSVNRTLDLKVRADGDGRNVQLPLVLGVDPTGIVTELGNGVDDFTVGDHVAVLPIRCGQCRSCRNARSCENQFHPGVERWGGYAEYITVPAWAVTRLPPELGFSAATVILRHYPTAHHLLATVARLAPGERILILGSAGGLGSAAVEVAIQLGADVIGGAGADERVNAAMSIGATWGVNYRTENLSEKIAAITNGQGVDVVVDNIGDATLWQEAFRCLGHNGRVVTAGAHGGGVVPLDVRRLYKYHLSVLGSSGRSEEDVEWTINKARSNVFRPLIGLTLPLAQAQKAHELSEANEIVGKIILDPTKS